MAGGCRGAARGRGPRNHGERKQPRKSDCTPPRPPPDLIPPPPRPRSQTQDPPAPRHLHLWSRLNPAPRACCRSTTSGNQLARTPALTFRRPPRRHCACADITSAWGKALRRFLARAWSAHAAVGEVVWGDGVPVPLRLGEFLCLGAPAAACTLRRRCAGGALSLCVCGRRLAEEMAING